MAGFGLKYNILAPNINQRGQKDLYFEAATKHMHARCAPFEKTTTYKEILSEND